MPKKSKFPKPRPWRPSNPQKYAGDPNKIISRSSWETRLMYWLDSNPSVIKWASEEIIIPYYSPVDGNAHRYFVDFWIVVQQKDGTRKKYLIEVKPESQTVPPVRGKKREKTFLNEVLTWETNKAKWEAAKKFAAKKDCEFIILTEKHILGN